jgi:hypothetical protein
MSRPGIPVVHGGEDVKDSRPFKVAILYQAAELDFADVTIGFASPEDRGVYLGRWAEGCRNAEEPLPVEGTDYELINLEGTQ